MYYVKWWLVIGALALACLLAGCSLDVSYSATCGRGVSAAKYENQGVSRYEAAKARHKAITDSMRK